MELESVDDKRIQAFNYMLIQKNKVARTYNKIIKRKIFEVGELVWKIILPVGSKDKELGKWSPNWEGHFNVHRACMEDYTASWFQRQRIRQMVSQLGGPFKVNQVLHGNAYS